MTRIGDRREMEAFVRSVELGGFSAAARELRLTPSAVSKLVHRLESTLRARLLNRTTRKLTPTAEGAQFLVHCRRILAEMEDAENEVGSARERPRGTLRLHVGVGFGTRQLVPALPRFLERYPEVQVDLIVEDRTADLVKEGVDISVRPGPPRDTTLVVRKICEFERVICASPEYLRRHGVPHSPDDLAEHNCITFTGSPSALAPWPFETPSGRRMINIAGSVSANNTECLLQLAIMGVGVARMNEFLVGEEFREGRLVPVLADYHCAEPLAMNASYLQDRHRLPRVKAMLNFLVESFAHAPWRTASPKAKWR
jgi:DNA-binding transcriptional LysR family regulator